MIKIGTVKAITVDNKKKAIFYVKTDDTNDRTIVNFGFVYGENLNDNDLSLDNINEKGSNENSGIVRAIYSENGTAPVQLFLCGLEKQLGTISAKAFIVYVGTDGATQIEYSEPMHYTYRS